MTIKNKLVLTPSGLELLCGPKAVRKWLGASQAEMGEILKGYDTDGRSGRQFRRSTISIWENGRSGPRWKMGLDIPGLYARIVEDTVDKQTSGRVAIRAKLGKRRWRFVPLATCATCGKDFVMKRSNQKNCGRHAK